MAASVGTARAESQTFVIANGTSEYVAVEFYSQDRDIGWPGGDEYEVDPNSTAEFNLICESGELICMGAWDLNDRSWGVGLNNQLSCEHCCSYCAGGTVEMPID